jgi:hypothetical protein
MGPVKAAILLLIAAGAAFPAYAQAVDDPYSIMAPEPGTAPPRPKARHGSSVMVYPSPLPAPQHYVPPPSQQVPPVQASVPPPLVVPQTGRVLPNLPLIGSGPGGAETSQDRALRCAHQAGVYGQAAGNNNAYVGGCINQ